MKNYLIKLRFLYDDADETGFFTIKVPENVSLDHVKKTLGRTHDELDSEDGPDVYGAYGRTPETLVEHVCEKNGWHYKKIKFDASLCLE